MRPRWMLPLGALLACNVLLPAQGRHADEQQPAIGSTFEQRARLLSERLARSLDLADTRTLRAALDLDALMHRAAAGLTLPNGYLAGARAGFTSGLESHGILASLRRTVEAGGSVDLVRVRARDGEVRATLRVLLPDLALRYWDLHLAPTGEGGEPRVVDWREWLVGTPQSAELRRELLEKTGRALENLATALAAGRALALVRKGRHADALAAMDAVPEASRLRTDVLLIRIGIAADLDAATHVREFERFAAADPTNPCIGLLGHVVYARAGETARALAAVDALERELGADPHLDFVRAAIQLRAALGGEPGGAEIVDRRGFAAAKDLAARAAAALPEHGHPHALRLRLARLEEDDAEAARILGHLRDRFGVLLETPVRLARAAELVDLPAHEAWAELRALPAPAKLEAATAFAERLQRLVAAGDTAGFRDAFDVQALTQLAAAGVNGPAAYRRGLRRGLARSFDVPEKVTAAAGDGGSFTLVGVSVRDGRPCALFRLLTADDELGYHEYHVGERNGEPAVIDVEVLATGDTMARSAASIARLLSPFGADVTKAWQEFIRLAQSGSHDEALALYERLPPALRENRTTLLMHLGAARSAGADEVVQVVDELARVFPGDAGVGLLAYGPWTAAGRHGDVLAALKHVRTRVQDPYLAVPIAAVLAAHGKRQAAWEELRNAVATAPDLVALWWAQVELALEQDDHATVAQLLTTLEERFGIEFTDLREVEVYADFVASPEYAAWLARRRRDR